jgi:multidrug efflux pump subunit AcrB
MNISRIAIRNYPITLTLFVLFLVMGVGSFLSMPQREDPKLDIANIIVVAVYPGASPEDIESQVVDPIEESINELDDLKEVVTTIRDGVAVTDVEFDFGVDSDEKLDDVQRQINNVREELPDGLYQLDVQKITTSTVNVLQLALISETAGYEAMEKEAERIKKMIEKQDGVRKVEVQAYPEQEVRIALDPVKMEQMGISIDDVEQAIQSNNANIPGGAVKVANKLFNIKTSGAYEDLSEIRNTVVGAHEGQLIYLKNIAEVFFAFEDDRWLARYMGVPAVYISVQQKDEYNIFDVIDPIHEILEGWTLPPGMERVTVFDQSEGVSSRVNGFLMNLLQGILLVGLIIFLALGYRSASIVMLAIPLSILIGLFLVEQRGYALQQMSIAGLVVALGLLVDNSIAIIENIERYLAMGYSRVEAAVEGTQQLTAPIISATLTTVFAFVPIVLMPDVTGAFIKALPITVIATLLASLLIALTLTPFISSRFLKENPGQTSLSGTWLYRQMHRFVTGPYRTALQWALDHRVAAISIAVVSLVGAFSLFPLVGVTFFPKAEKPQFRITVSLPNGSNLEATDQAVRFVEDVLSRRDEVRSFAANVGHGNPRIYYNVVSTNYTNSFGEVFVLLKDYDVRSFYPLLEELREELSAYTGARIDVREFVQGPPSEAPVAIKIYGEDLEKLRTYALQVENIVRQTEGAINVENPLRTNSTDLFFRINRDKAMMLGVPVFAVDNTIRTFVNGSTIGTYRNTDGDDFPIVMRYAFDEKFQIEDFDRISVQSVSGRFVPVKHLAGIEFEEAPSRISHLDYDRTATVLADLGQGYTLDPVVNSIREELDEMDWENGYSYEFKGDLESRNESFGGMGVASVIALVLILGVLILQFKSFLQPLIIFSALPLAMIGSILALLVTGIPFSFTGFIGLTSLIGIAINNSIVLVDFANEELSKGASIREAVTHAGEVRFIPIVLTTLTTILGLLPLTLAGGSLWAPMGWVIIGGLISSTFFVLLLVPVLYQLLTRKSKNAEVA